MTAWQCEECGEPLERGRCPDRECREPIAAAPDEPTGPQWVRDLLANELELRDPPADPRSVLP